MTKETKKITILAELHILPGYEKEVLAAAEKVWIATRQECGCEAFLFHTKVETESTIVFFEVFKSAEDFTIHKDAKHTETFLTFLKGKVQDDGPTLAFLNKIED